MKEKELLQRINILRTKLLCEPNGKRTSTGIRIDPCSHVYCQNAQKLIECVNQLVSDNDSDYADIVSLQEIGSWKNHELSQILSSSTYPNLSETMNKSNERMERIFVQVFQKIEELK